MKDLIQLWFEDVMCFINLETNEVYSAKLKKLKGLKHARTSVPYYIIQYNSHKVTKSLNQLRRLAHEKLQSNNSELS